MAGPWILGLAASHNGAACLLEGTRIVVAIQEERLTRVKRAPLVPSLPFKALDYVLETAGITVEDLDMVVLAPLHSPNAAHHDLDRHPRLASVPRAIISHHYAHAMGAYAQSGFDESAICVIDAMGSMSVDLPEDERRVVLGPWLDLEQDADPGCEPRELVSFYEASGGALTPLEKHLGAHQLYDPQGDMRPRMMGFVGLGVMYMAVAQQIFGHWSASGKVMGLAPLGTPRYGNEDFWHVDGDTLVFKDALHQDFRYGERWPQHGDAYADLAASVQSALEGGLEHLWSRLRRATQSRHLCYAGGVALNSVANERLIQSGAFTQVFIMPAAEDCGTAIGAAYHGLYALTGPRRGPGAACEFLGRDYGLGTPSDALLDEVCDRLIAGEVIAWFQGGSEFGPRALGHRSRLFDPRRHDASERLNLKVKGREAFRPFAPVVMNEYASDWFDLDPLHPESPFMLRVVPVSPSKRARVPAITHVDGSTRPQTLRAEQAPSLYRLLACFYEKTGVPMLLNTSLNVMGEPIVETPDEALSLLNRLEIDALVLGAQLMRASTRG